MTYIPSAIKSLQRGTITMPSGATTASVAVTAVNLAQAGLRFNGASIDSGGTESGYTGIYMSSASQITAYRTSAIGNLTIEWELVEYVLALIKSVQRGLITNNGVAVVNQGITPVTMVKAELRHLGNSTTNGGTGNLQDCATRLELTATNNIQCTVGSTSFTEVTSWELIEFK